MNAALSLLSACGCNVAKNIKIVEIVTPFFL